MCKKEVKISTYLSNPESSFHEEFITNCDEYISENYSALTNEEIKYIASEINGEFMNNPDLEIEDYTGIVDIAIFDIENGEFEIKYL